MICNTRDRSNYTTETQKEKRPVLIFMQEESETWMFNACKQIWKVYILTLKSLVMLKCESRSSLHALQCKWQPGSVLKFCPYYFKNG